MTEGYGGTGRSTSEAAMIDWTAFRQGMDSARSTGEPGAQLTTKEIDEVHGHGDECKTPPQRDWHAGYDYAIRLSRA